MNNVIRVVEVLESDCKTRWTVSKAMPGDDKNETVIVAMYLVNGAVEAYVKMNNGNNHEMRVTIMPLHIKLITEFASADKWKELIQEAESPPEIIECGECQTDNDGDANFCKNCGESFDEESVPATPEITSATTSTTAPAVNGQ